MTNETKLTLSTEAIANITEAVRVELLKRGVVVNLTGDIVERPSCNRLELVSNNFQTTPVIMKEIRIEASFSIFYPSDAKEGEKAPLTVAGRVGVAYTHFSGGSNGTELFTFRTVIHKDNCYNIETF